MVKLILTHVSCLLAQILAKNVFVSTPEEALQMDPILGDPSCYPPFTGLAWTYVDSSDAWFAKTSNSGTWESMNSYCLNQGDAGMLFAPQSADENNVYKIFSSSSSEYFTGGFSFGPKTNWYWFNDGDDITKMDGYTNWDKSKPSNTNGKDVVTIMTKNGKWTDQYDYRVFEAICEYRCDSGGSGDPTCYPPFNGLSWTYVNSTDAWFAQTPNKGTWESMNQYCLSIGEGGMLFAPKSEEENNVYKIFTASNGDLFLGGFSFGAKTNWYWYNDGADFTVMEYTNWAKNKPSDTNGKDVVSMNAKNGEWSDSYDYKIFEAICEYRCDSGGSGSLF